MWTQENKIFFDGGGAGIWKWRFGSTTYQSETQEIHSTEYWVGEGSVCQIMTSELLMTGVCYGVEGGK